MSKLNMFIGSMCLRDMKNDCFFVKENFGKDVIILAKGISDCISNTRKKIDPKINKEILDVEFNEIVADPMKVVQKIYDRAGIELTEEAKQAMSNYLEENAKQRKEAKGSHHCPYTLEEFDLTEDMVKEAFKEYRKERNYV